MHACSGPPIYISTGNHFESIFSSKGFPSSCEHGYLKKYQLEQTNVSIVSVSRVAGPPHVGHLVVTNFLEVFSGDFPSPFGVKSISIGSLTGKSFSATATSPHLSQ